MQAGLDGLLHDKTRPSRIPPLAPTIVGRVVALTQTDSFGETAQWTAAATAAMVDLIASAVQRIWRGLSGISCAGGMMG